MSSYQHLVSLGSSFAAGPGIEPVVDRAAGRSGANYAALLAERLGARHTDLSVSGATTANLLSEPQRSWRSLPPGRFQPQMEGIPADADLITITAGGNDLGYIGGLMRAAFAGKLRVHLPTRWIGLAVGRNAVPTAAAEDVQRAAAGLASVVEAARRRAPGALIVLVDYLPVLGPATQPSSDLPLQPSEIAAFRNIADRLTGVLSTAARHSGATLVTGFGTDHVLGSSGPWVTGLRSNTGAPFHPNAEGMRGVADLVHRMVNAAAT